MGTNEEIMLAANDLKALAEALKTHTMSLKTTRALVTTVLEAHGLTRTDTNLDQEPVQRKKKMLRRTPVRLAKTITEQVAEIFHDYPDHAFTERQLVNEVARRSPGAPHRSLSQTISVMKNAGLITRIDTYPSRFKSAMTETKREDPPAASPEARE